MESQWDQLRSAVHVWQLWLKQVSVQAMRERNLHRLSVDERGHYESLGSELLRHEYLSARALCRAVLSRYTGVDSGEWIFGNGRYGKPRIVEPARFRSLQFNVTHIDDLVICAVTRAGSVGIDAEKISRAIDIAQVARHFLSDRERARLTSLLPEERVARFFELWVLKEAYLKGIGKGLPEAPERFTVDLSDNGDPLPLPNWHLSLRWLTSSHVAAVAVHTSPKRVPISVKWLQIQDLFETGVTVVGGQIPNCGTT